ncbi:signal peptidase I [Nocardioides dongxiaopingii]|uniref:signal peptidase I n=1 Tax=Nocardioides dongxiaopingii TaxID=2576036 RepID=UPI0010C76853|nr:signal peptidase I [Nocardioides dongxiaopingii]
MTTDESAPSPVDGASVVRGGPHRRRSPWQESLVLLVLAVVLAIVVKTFFLQAFYIPSSSMEPGLVENDRILVQKVSTWFGGSPERGDVIVFEDPGGWLTGPPDTTNGLQDALSRVGLLPSGGHLVKRVVGVAGDTVTCCDEQGRILVNGVPVDEDGYVAERPAGRSADVDCNGPMIGCEWSAGPVPDGEVFVMGDNRDDSADSTVHLCLPDEVDCARDPFVDLDLVVGTVFAVAWPLGNARFLGRPDSFDAVPDAG